MSERTQTGISATTALRIELKQWEKEFALAHDGRKPSRLDIKNDTSIAAKYKAFHRLSSSSAETDRLRSTPKKAARHSDQKDHVSAETLPVFESSTPIKNESIQIHHNIHNVEPTPAHIKCALGPTPQKDGQVLGLFDSLTAGTPSAQRYLQSADMATPSSLKLQVHAEKLSRTPQTASKRFYMDLLAGTTPKRKRAEDDHSTPSTAKRQCQTPTFLRKSWQIDEGRNRRTEPFMARKGLVRSLSSMIADMRKQENDEADEEWEIMRELEHEQESGTRQVIKDSQAVEMPLGPDELPASDESDDSTAPERKPWKKKGLKRQTKRVKMKPVLHAPQKASALEEENVDEEDHEDMDKIAESQLEASKNDEQNEVNRPIQKAVRKVSELAHANFRKLKIKNKNSKASGRRFGRR